MYCAQEVETVKYTYHSMPKIYAIVDNHQVDHQEEIIKMEGTFCDQSISILIELGLNYSYISPMMVKK